MVPFSAVLGVHMTSSRHEEAVWPSGWGAGL